MALHHAVGIHNPAHDFFVCVHIRRQDILIGANKGQNHGGIPSSQPLAFAVGNLLHIHIDAAISAAIWDVGQGALQCSQPRQRLDLLFANAGMIPHAAFAGPPQGGMLHPIAFKQPSGAVVHLHGNGHFQLALWIFHKFIFHPLQAHTAGGFFHIVRKNFIGVAICPHFSPTFLYRLPRRRDGRAPVSSSPPPAVELQRRLPGSFLPKQTPLIIIP